MRINKVRIFNFRKYLGIHEFDISKQITIFYGPNGFGKSTFFDALEWCISGVINRFARQKEFSEKDVFCFQCDKRSALCCVEIEFDGHILKRSFRVTNGIPGNVSVTINRPSGPQIRGKGPVDQFLRREFYRTAGRATMGGLIKQSHILSQDQITDFILRDDAKGRFEALADIMGLKNMLSLLDNMKEVMSKLSTQRLKLIDQADQHEFIIEQRKSDVLPIDLSKIEKWAKALDVPSTIKEVHADIHRLQEQLLEQSGANNEILECLENIRSLGHQTIHECLTDERKHKNLLDAYSVQQDNTETLLTRVKLVISSLSGDKVQYEKLRKLENEERKCLRVLQPLSETELPELYHLVQSISEKQRVHAHYETVLTYIQEYQELLRDLETIPFRVGLLDIKLERLQKRHVRLEMLRNEVNNRLSDHTGGPLVKLVTDMRSINDYVSEHHHDGTCPVCTAHHGDQLGIRIHTSIEQHMRKISQYTELTEELMKRKNKFLDKLEQTEKALQQCQDDRRINESRLQNIKERLNLIQGLQAFNKEMFSLSKKILQETRDVLLSEIKIMETAKEALDSLTKIRGDLENLRLTTGLNKSVTEAEISLRLQRLQRATTRLENYITIKKQLSKQTKRKLDSISKVLIRLPEELRENNVETHLDKLIEQKSKEKKLLLTEYAEASSFVQTYSNNQHINTSIDGMLHEKRIKEVEIQIYDTKMNDISTFLKTAGSELGSTAKDILNKSSSTIQRYFRYLNPLPNTNIIRFEGEQDELKIMVQLPGEEKHLSNVQYTLSSGQLNVLAISIFLAINKSQQVSILDFVAIDDPIQNMDDVNQFSVCDVLGTIEKQLLFATHDFDFVKLFIKKHEHRKEEIQVYMIDSPSLVQEKIKRLTFT